MNISLCWSCCRSGDAHCHAVVERKGHHNLYLVGCCVGYEREWVLQWQKTQLLFPISLRSVSSHIEIFSEIHLKMANKGSPAPHVVIGFANYT